MKRGRRRRPRLRRPHPGRRAGPQGHRTVHGVDASPAVLEALAAGRPHLFEPGIEEGLRELLGDRLHVAADAAGGRVDAVVICVSTPGRRRDAPAVWRTSAAAARARRRARAGPDTLVVVRSTVPIGTSRAVVLPELLAAGARARWPWRRSGPSRARRCASSSSCRRWSAGSTRRAASGGRALRAAGAAQIVPVSSLETAEMVKLVNNCHTDLIYAFGNEVALHRRAARPRSARGHPRDQPRLPAAGPRQARLRRRRLPVEGPVHHDQRARRGRHAPFLVGAARAAQRVPAGARRASGSSSCSGERRGRAEGARLVGARLGVQGLAAHRRHARHADRADDADLPAAGIELLGHDPVAPTR